MSTKAVGPGETWRVEEADVPIFSLRLVEFYLYVTDADGHVVAVIPSRKSDGARRDARLIASAPALRDLCRQFVEADANNGAFDETSGGVRAAAYRAERLLAHIDGEEAAP